MPTYTDQLGRTIELPNTPKRIISLVPSITELLYTLQLEEQVTGITKFCVHPQHWFRQKTRIGGTKTIKADVIHRLQPDLIIANKEENVQQQVNDLAAHYPVWVSDVNCLTDALDMITQIGVITNTTSLATNLVNTIRNDFNELSITIKIQQYPPLPTAYLIWREPYMTIGGDTFIHDMLTRCGLLNLFAGTTRYPTVTLEQLQQCQLLLLSSEPFPFQQKHIDELQPQLPNTRIVLVDGELFSWYGSRLLHAPDYFTKLLNSTFVA